MKCRPFFHWVFLLPVTLSAQNNVDYTLYMEAARERSILFKGAFPMRYGYQMANDGSTFYAFSPTAERGTLVFYGKVYQNVLLNLNTYTDELYAFDPVTNLPVVVNKHGVDSFSLGTHRFVRYAPEAGALLKEGYYELLYSGRLLLCKKIQKQFRDEISNGKIIQRYLLVENFYVCTNNTWVRINSKAEVKRLFPDQKRAINRLVKTKELDFRNHKGVALFEIITYIDHL